jgi:hypothetical protein
MSILYSPVRARFGENSFWVDLRDGRVTGVPLAGFPRLLHGTAEQREQVRTSNRGLHWDALDKDVLIEALLAGLGDQSSANKTFAA